MRRAAALLYCGVLLRRLFFRNTSEMNKKVLIGAVLLLVLFLSLPLLGRKNTSGGSVDNAKFAEPLTATSLVGTSWSVKTPDIPVAVMITLNPNNQAVATVPGAMSVMARQMLGTDVLVGVWNVEGDKLKATVSFKGKNYEVLCDIQGNKLIYKGAEIRRIS